MTIFPKRHPGRPLSVLGALALLALGDLSAGAYLIGFVVGRRHTNKRPAATLSLKRPTS